ncbi:phosphoribosylformylglycinamidine cyclo-ligase, partial [filamentous cyanobacterium CCP5]
SWAAPEVFTWLAKAGSVSPKDMFDTFNMGIGFAIVLPTSEAEGLVKWLSDRQLSAWIIGSVVSGEGNLLGLP